MKIMIGSARRDENGKYTGGKAGDQLQKSSVNDTVGEVSMQPYYVHKLGWYLFRFIIAAYAIAFAEAMRQACNNKYIGYDQGQRLTIMAAIKKYGSMDKIAEPTECDCSSLIRACIYQATGIDVGNFNTATEAAVLEKSGLFEKKVAVTPSTIKYDGDILVTKSKGHTVSIVSGNPRPTSTSISTSKEANYKMKTLKKGSTGNDVTIFESIMKKMGYYDGDIDESFGPKCVDACNAFQKDYPECGTKGRPDGSFGPKCWAKTFALLEA